MAFSISIPFYAFKLHLSSSFSMLSPLRDPEVLRMAMPLNNLAAKYESAIQHGILNKGNATHLLKEWSTGTFEKNQVQVLFPAAKDGLTYPAFSLEFDYYFQDSENGVWALVPTLGIESFAQDQIQLQEHLAETIRIEFARKAYLSSIQNIISAIWYEGTELVETTLALRVADPGEDLTQSNREEQTKTLRKVAKALEIQNQEIYGREELLQQLEQIFKGDFGRNILLVGPSGVGKTGLVWEWSRLMKEKSIPGTIWETTASNLIKELSGDNGWEFNIGELCKELKGQRDHFLFVKSLIDLFEVGKYEGNSVSMADYLLPFIARGEINIIAECTDDELARIELESPTYTANFQLIRLEEPKENLEAIILQKVKDIADQIQLEISSEAVKEVIRLTRRFTPYAGMPGRPIRFLESILLNKIKKKDQSQMSLGRTEVIEHFCDETGMPKFMVDPSIPLDPDQIKGRFHENVFGQDMAVNSLANTLATVKVALNKSGRPIGSFLFVGPTGVGKTEMAKVLAGFMFGNRDRMLRFDMSEYSNPYSVMRLIGQDANSEGLLTAAIRREPFSVLLFDEIEKADPTFFDLLLQVLSEGRLTDNRGNLANFCSAIIIMTSNIGARQMQWSQIGVNKTRSEMDVFDHFDTAVRKYFRPELYNRIDRIIPFQPLDQDTVRFVVDREVSLFKELEGIKFRKLDLEIDPEVYDYLAQRGFDPQYGARYLQRILREKLIIPVARKLNQLDFDDQIQLRIFMDQDKVQVSSTSDDLTLELLLEELNKIQHADYAAACRRELERFMEGFSFTSLLQSLDQLELQKKKLGDKFWDNALLSKQYSRIMELKTSFEETLVQITALENELALMALGFAAFAKNKIDELEHWESDLFFRQIALFTFLNPDQNKTYLGVFGQQVDAVVQLYLEVLSKKEWAIKGKAIWHRAGTDSAATAYLSSAIPYHSPSDVVVSNWKAPQDGLVLVGVEIQINGPGSALYLKNESRILEWKFNGQKDLKKIMVEVDTDPVTTPEGVHRNKFLQKKKANRRFTGKSLEDKTWGLQRELSVTQLPELLQAVLDEDFKYALKTSLLD